MKKRRVMSIVVLGFLILAGVLACVIYSNINMPSLLKEQIVVGNTRKDNDVDDELMSEVNKWKKSQVNKESLSLSFCHFIIKNPGLFYEVFKEEREIYDEWVANIQINVFGSNREDLRQEMIAKLTELRLPDPVNNWNRYLVSKLEYISPIQLNGVEEEGEINWRALDYAWKAFVNYPSSDNANRVYNLLPDQRYRGKDDPSVLEKECRDSIYKDLAILGNEVIGANREAVKLAFKLFTISDGAFSESICITLGDLIRINPEMFLEELKNHRKYVSRISTVLGNLGYVFVDRYEAHKYAINQRIKALKSVTNPMLSEMRLECLEVLNKINDRRPNKYYPPR